MVYDVIIKETDAVVNAFGTNGGFLARMAFFLLTRANFFVIIYKDAAGKEGDFMNIAIVDDAQMETKAFIHFVKEYGALNRIETDVTSFCCAEDFLEDYAPLKYTFIVLDIFMNGMTGLEAAAKIKERDRNALIVFLSSSEEHYPEALRLHAFDFLNKPTTKDRIFRLLDDITSKITEPCSNLKFTCGKETIRLPYSRIASVTSSGHYSEITDEDKTVYKTRMPYTEVCMLLSEDRRFLEINRGTSVNLDMIVNIDDEGICCLKNGMNFPVNVKNSRSIRQIWQNYMFDVLRNETVRRK